MPGLRYQELASLRGNGRDPPDVIRMRVNTARSHSIAAIRENQSCHANAKWAYQEIKRFCAVKEDAEKLLETAINKLGLSARAYSRVLKVGRTIADLAGTENIEASHIAEARFSTGA